MKLLLKDIEKSFSSKKVLNNASFTFEKGHIYGLLGRNGAGKTTLFNCISEEIELDNGSVSLVDDSGNALKLDHSKIGYVFSEPILPDFLTGYEFLKFYIDINRADIEEVKSIDEYLQLIKMTKEDSQKLIKGYSHGMKNKIQMLCCIISRPPVILLDEPLTSFDVVVALEMKNLLKEMKSEHILIFSTHIMQLAVDLCDELVILNNGILDKVDKEILSSENLEERIIDLLKESKDA